MKSQQKVNLPVIALDTGSIMGRVDRLLLSSTEKKVTDLFVTESTANRYFLLPFSHVMTMGHDALVIQSSDALVEVQVDDPRVTGAVAVVNQEIVNTAGTILGRALDYTVDDKTGDLLNIDCFDYELREKTGIEAEWLADDMGQEIVIRNMESYRKRWFPVEIRPTPGRSHEVGKKVADTPGGKKQPSSSYEIAIRKIIHNQAEMRRKITTLADRQLFLEHRLQDLAFARTSQPHQEDLQIKIGALLDRQLSLEEVIQDLSGEMEEKTNRPDVQEETRKKVSVLGEQLQVLEKSVQELSQALERNAQTYSRREDVKRNIDALSVRLLTLERIQQELSANMSESSELYVTKQEETQAQVDLFLNRQLALEKQQMELSERISQTGMDTEFCEQMQQKWDAVSEQLLSMERQQQEMYAHARRDRQTLDTLYASLKELRTMAMEQAKKEIPTLQEPDSVPELEPNPVHTPEDSLMALQKLQQLKEDLLCQLRGEHS